MDFLRIKETCLYVNDLAQAKAFYNEVLQLKVIAYVEGKHLFLRAGESVLLLFDPRDSATKTSPPAHSGGGNQHFAFEVPDDAYERAKEEIRQKGIEIIDEITWKSGKKSFYFRDPAGNVLEVLPDKGVWD